MRKLLTSSFGSVLLGLIGNTWWINTSYACFLFFGEQPFPTEEDCK